MIEMQVFYYVPRSVYRGGAPSRGVVPRRATATGGAVAFGGFTAAAASARVLPALPGASVHYDTSRTPRKN